MYYLLYLRNGFIKKFPLDKQSVSLGRLKKHDLCIEEPFVSKDHARITVHDDHIEITDMGSTNGVFVGSEKVSQARIDINQWFRVGYIKFFLKEGNAQELVLSDKVQPVLNKISNLLAAGGEKTEVAINLLYDEPLADMLQIGFGLHEPKNIFRNATEILNKTVKSGSLVIISHDFESYKVISEWNCKGNYLDELKWIVNQYDIFKSANKNRETGSQKYFCSFPIVLQNKPSALIYLTESHKKTNQTLFEFIETLSIEIALIDNLISHDNRLRPDKKKSDIPEIISINHGILNLLSQCKKIANSSLFVLIQGETGTGKEMLANFIHFNSKRKGGNLIAINCSAIPENLMEVELFGHEKGAFTDAKSQRRGKLELASGGTLVLDEIGDMPLNLQAKLLRVIQEGKFYRIGGSVSIDVDLRIICLTNKNITGLIQEKLFRNDLYYRISHVVLNIPPLRERKEDIIPLINYFSRIFSQENNIYIKGYSQKAIRAMEKYDWPGNVRELENEIRKIINLSENNDIIDFNLLKDEIQVSYSETEALFVGDQSDEKELIMKLLEKHKWNKSKVSDEMNISRTAFYNKLKKYDIEIH